MMIFLCLSTIYPVVKWQQNLLKQKLSLYGSSAETTYLRTIHSTTHNTCSFLLTNAVLTCHVMSSDLSKLWRLTPKHCCTQTSFSRRDWCDFTTACAYCDNTLACSLVLGVSLCSPSLPLSLSLLISFSCLSCARWGISGCCRRAVLNWVESSCL